MKKVQDRSISNDRAECEVCVAVNGPLLQHADSVIRACPEGDVQEQERHEEQGREVYQEEQQNTGLHCFQVSRCFCQQAKLQALSII